MTENKQIAMEIINSERFHRANIKFNGIPKEEIRKELKEAGWLYSRNNNLWYPKNEAAAASLTFAEHIKSTYFAENEELKVSEKKPEPTRELSDKELLIQMINGGSSLNEIVKQMQEIYGESAVHEAFGIAKTVENEAPQILKEAEEELFNETYNQSELALQDTITDKYFLIQECAEGGWDWTLYDKELNEIDGGLAADITPDEKTQVLEAAKMILSDLNPEDFEFTRWNRRDYDAIRELIHQVEQSKAIQAANEAEKAKATDENEPVYTIGGHTYKKSQIEAELREDIESIFRNLVPEPYLAGISLYQNPEKSGKINLLVQYGTDPMEGTWREDDLFNAIAEEEIYFNGLPVDVNPITPEKSGTIDEYLARLERLGAESEEEAISKQEEMLEAKEETHKPKIYSFEPFGYEGTLVMIETDLRHGIPAYDIVGISDGMVKEVRERIRAAFRNSGLELPPERILQSVSPADIRKEGNIETLAMALDLLNEQNSYNSDDILVLGDLELSGRIRPVRSVHAAVVTAKANGITKVIVPEENAEEALGVEGIQVLSASSLSELDKKLRTNEPFTQNAEIESPESSVEFDEEALSEIYDMNLDGYYDTARAIEIAIAGKHNILLNGAPGCGKTLLTTRLMPALTPKLTTNEAQTVTRIHSLAGLLRPDEGLVKRTPFRMPHQTASIEGICGGGPNCRPGEISLAHNGTLFLDEAAEFRSSVLQMLRVPLESGSITLSRAGRSTVYPANFQLAMATNPCPCGNYGSHDRLCLCSEKSIDLYWKKFSAPLIDRVEIKQTVDKDDDDKRRISVFEMKKHIENAFRIQREHEHYNSKLNAIEEANLCKLNEECQEYFDRRKDDYTPRQQQNMLKVALTIANMDNRREISLDDLKESVELVAPIFEKPHVYKRDQSTVKFGGFEYNSYYHSVKTRDLCHDIKQTENAEAHKKAVKEMADYLASQIKSLPGKVVLVPAPQHTGNAEYTLEIAKLIAAGNTNCDLLDVLKCEPHDTLYDQKKEGNRQPELNFYLKEGFDIASIPSDTKIFFIDNVISSGNTFNTANNLFDGRLFPLVYASSDFASFDIQDGKVVITDTREKTGINSVTRKEEQTISGGIQSVKARFAQGLDSPVFQVDNDFQPRINTVTREPVQLTEVDLDICKMVIPPAQYRFTLELTQGEEGEFFKKKLKDIADTYRRINTDRTLVNEDGTHNVGFRYFLGNTEIYISQIYTDGIGFGYTILNGDLQMSEWGDSSIEEITSVPFIEMDYHIPEGATIERLLYERHPDYFEEPGIQSVKARSAQGLDSPVFRVDNNSQPGIQTVTSEEKENATSEGINTVTSQTDTTPGIKSVTRNYSFYIRDTAEFEAFAEIEPVTGLSAREAVENLLDLDTKDFSVGIGIVVPGSIDHGTEFEDTGVCEIYKRNGNWILDDIFLDSGHSVSQNENYIAAIDELLEEAENFGMEIEVPQVFHDLHKGIQSVTNTQPSAETSKSILEEYPDGLYEEVIRKHVSEEAQERISDEVKKIEQKNGWSFSYEALKEYGEEYERAVKESDWETLYKIDYHLTDSNFHTECSLLSEYKFDEFRKSIAKEFGRELPESIAPVAEEIKTVTTEKAPKTKGQMKDIREQCREILQKPDSKITEEDKAILAQYEGGGGLNEENRSSSEVLNEFYTPKNLVEKVWEIADHYSPDAVTVLEPSSGIGRFAENRPKNQFTMHEKNEVSARINRLLHPEATVIEASFQKQFFDEGERFRKTDVTLPTYDVVIGNPPYGDYNDKYKGLGEGKEFNRYEEYFISRGLDSLKDENSILVFVVPSGFLNTASDKAKHIIASKGILIDAYRLPECTFPTTKVGTDIIVMKNRERCIDETYGERWENLDKYQKEEVIFTELAKISDGKWFKDHPETVLGQIKTRTNKFGKEEDYVTVRDGRTIQDELNRISDLLNGGDGSSNQMEPVYPAVSKTDTTMTAKEFSKLYGKDFEEENYTVWSKADWEGKIKTSDLSKSEMEYLAKSKDYVQERPGTWTHRVLFESGDIYKKIDEQKNLLSGALLREDTEKSFEFFSLLRYSDIFVFLKISLYGVATVFSVHAKA
jgi:magnesium chelatase family protein